MLFLRPVSRFQSGSSFTFAAFILKRGWRGRAGELRRGAEFTAVAKEKVALVEMEQRIITALKKTGIDCYFSDDGNFLKVRAQVGTEAS